MSVQPAPGVDDTILSPDGNTLLAVLKSTDDITDWTNLALVLGLKPADIERIELDNSKAAGQKRAFIKKWLDKGTASWATLVSALRHSEVDKNAIANEIAKGHPKGGSSPQAPQYIPPQQTQSQAEGTVQKSKPDLEDVLDQLKQQSNKWNEIGGGLRVGFDFRQCQLRDGAMTTAQQKLEAVLNKWIESKCSEVSWNHLIQVLIDIELGGVADEVKSYLQTDPNAIKKYHWVSSV